MTDNGLAAFSRRYIACCDEHRFGDLGELVAPDVVINGPTGCSRAEHVGGQVRAQARPVAGWAGDI